MHPAIQPLANDFIAKCKATGLPLVIVETRRTKEVMEAYYERGRNVLFVVNAKYAKAGLRPITEEENKSTITNCMPGESWHYFGLALDFVPVVNGKADWIYNPADPADHWDEIADIAKSIGFVWGGNFRSFQDRPHIEWHPGWSTDRRMRGVGLAYALATRTNDLWIPIKGVYGDQTFQFPI
jgi:peptidoglycan L-alanyl-D-glutamate endopeptidase CwlK